jgi:hypothetical protein
MPFQRSHSIEIGGREYQLNVTLQALLKLHRRFRSIGEAADRVRLMDFVAICDVVAIGAGLKDEEVKGLQAAVFRHGVLNVTGGVADYLASMLDPEGGDESSGEA